MRCHSCSGQPSGLWFQRTMDAPHHDKEITLTRERRRYASHAETKQDYETRLLGLEEDRTLKQWGGLNAETRGGIEPMEKIFLLTFFFIGLPDRRPSSRN